MKRIINTIILNFVIFFTITSAQEFTIEVIQEGDGIEAINATGINNNGVVVGTGWKPSYGARGFVYENGVMMAIYFSGSDYYWPLSISDNDNFIGTVNLPNSVQKGYFNYEFLPGLGSDDSWAMDINNSDQILGFTSDSQMNYIVIYENGQIIYSYPLPEGDTKAINDSGFVTGTDYPGGTYGRAYIYNYEENQFNYLPVIGVEEVGANDINNLNQIVGYFYDTDSTVAGFIWEDNNYTFLPTKSVATAINDSGVVVGRYRPINFPPQHAFVYDHVNGFRDLNDLIPAGTGWELTGASDINDLGQIVGSGTLNGFSQSYILTPNTLIVTRPFSRELFIAGELDTIKWIGGGNIDSVKIIAILNWNTALQTEIVVDQSIPGSEGSFVWNIPDTLLSYKTKIRIEDKINPSFFAESRSFRLKGYVLTRVKSDSTYEKFGRTIHAWQFGNEQSNMWPSTWWSQFTYRTAIDPYTSNYYYVEFHNINASKFPDWLAFVRAFGVNQCYWSDPVLGLYYRDTAIDFWKSKVDSWAGSCFGFSTSSLLAFKDVNSFITAYPEMPPFNNLYQFPNTLTGVQGDSIRAIINSLQIHQFGKQHRTYLNSILSDTPIQTLNKIKNVLLKDNTDGGLLRIKKQTGKGAHAIVVYKLIKSTLFPNNYDLSVYDNSYPANLSAKITIDTVTNSWNAPLWGWGGNLGIQLREEISSYFNLPILPKGPLDTDSPSDNLQIETYVARTSDIIITDSFGNSIGSLDSVFFNTIPNAFPIIFDEPSYAPPQGYNLPTGDYGVRMSSFSDSAAFLYLYNEDGIYSYYRNDAQENQADYLNIGTGFSITNHDQAIKNIELKTTMPQIEEEKVFQFQNVSFTEGDSVFVKEENREYFTFKNFGSQKSYDLKIKFNSGSFRHLFKHIDVPFNQNSTHLLYPQWDSLSTAPVKILIDSGNDGTIDDSIFVFNEATDLENQGYLGIPKEYNLSQNYPNPFNPVTRIRYSIPQTSFVTIKVYDILGSEVATLINEEKPAGNYEVEFQAESLPSGVYLYKLQTGSFVATKKMLLLK
jgi:probable HAF family extracellular repeat protein